MVVWASVAIFAVAAMAENEVRYVLISADAVLVTGAAVVFREALAEAAVGLALSLGVSSVAAAAP